ncbi:hypothetical protein FHX44_114727 [Pseudonocardia hierapolitana]|uniref:Uncharacterized protein n=1 Tax=Pseudonocardia hierapolitana TaxID=1128676 RepID=A0A561SVB0_9PSEU|nr:hypothetical protein [Pseudonocardia hierapolitana]TWF78803.1 hypothetical protein FHX44_114727 [Pseudonocardia hierapolitana]
MGVEEAPAVVAGRYRLCDVVGADGMGAVWRAVDDLCEIAETAARGAVAALADGVIGTRPATALATAAARKLPPPS